MLIDTGPAPLAGDFVARVCRVIDPVDLRYVWITHADPDHVGALASVLEAAPQARVVTNFLGAGKLGSWASVDAPWLSLLRRDSLEASLQELCDLSPDWVLGSHLPPARGLLPALAEDLAGAAGLTPFVGPDQAAAQPAA